MLYWLVGQFAHPLLRLPAWDRLRDTVDLVTASEKERPMPEPVSLLMLEFLTWIALGALCAGQLALIYQLLR